MYYCTTLLQKFHDFAEIASETISEINKKDGDKVVPMWTKEEVDEIVVAQVKKEFLILKIFKTLKLQIYLN